MIRVIYTILVIAIKDFELRCKKKNLLIGKSVIQFELYTQKNKTVRYLL